MPPCTRPAVHRIPYWTDVRSTPEVAFPQYPRPRIRVKPRPAALFRRPARPAASRPVTTTMITQIQEAYGPYRSNGVRYPAGGKLSLTRRTPRKPPEVQASNRP